MVNAVHGLHLHSCKLPVEKGSEFILRHQTQLNGNEAFESKDMSRPSYVRISLMVTGMLLASEIHTTSVVM